MLEIPQWISSLLSVIVGGLLVGLFNWRINKTNKEFEERQKIREIMFNNAIEVWKKETDLKVKKVEWGHPQETIYGLEAYILRMAKLNELLIKDDFKTEDVEQKIKEVVTVWKEARKTLNEI